MEFIYFILLIAILFVVISNKSKIKFFEREILIIHQKNYELVNLLLDIKRNQEEMDRKSKAEQNLEVPQENSIPSTPAFDVQTHVVEEMPSATAVDILHENQDASSIIESYTNESTQEINDPNPISSEILTESSTSSAPISKINWWTKFKQEHPDMEKFVGENLINKIGILILVLGIGFFVKYAIDKDWISEIARVGIGILIGGVLMGIAHKLHDTYKAFSSVFVAGAIGIFYFTIGIAFQDYHLFSQTTAFVIMSFITVLSCGFSLLYNRQELAILTLFGGFLTPFIVSSGGDNFVVLFTYLLVLNTGILVLSIKKRWAFVNYTALLLSLIIIGGWYFKNGYGYFAKTYGYALLFSALFYLLFTIIFTLNNLKNTDKYTKHDLKALLLNTAFYYGISFSIVHIYAPAYQGLFHLLLALVNLGIGYFIWKKSAVKNVFFYVFIGLCLTFVTLVIPAQFSGNYITAFWACEGVLLFYLYQKSKIKDFVIGGIIVQILTILSLVMDWQKYYFNENPYGGILLNNVFITGIVVVASYLVTRKWFMPVEEKIYFKKTGTFSVSTLQNILLIIALVFGYLVPIFDLCFWTFEYTGSKINAISVGFLYHSVYCCLLITLFKNWSKTTLNMITAVVTGFNFLCYTFLISRLPLIKLHNLDQSNVLVFILHYFITITVLYQLYILIKRKKEHVFFSFLNANYWNWILMAFLVYVVSIEIQIHSLCFVETVENIRIYKKIVFKTAFPIAWGIVSLISLILGIKYNWKYFRFAALTLMGVTVLKLFLYDMNESSESGKIVAFIILGIIILSISFMYQKLKKLVINTTDENEKLE